MKTASALALLLAVPVFSAEKAPKKPTSKELAKTVLEGVEKLDKELSGLSFGFTQTLRMTETGLEQSVEGDLKFRKPDQIRIDYSKPRVQRAFADKKTVRVFTPADNLVVQGDWETWRKRQAGISHLLRFGDYAKLLKQHRVEASEAEDGGAKVYDVRLTPKKKKDKDAYALRILFDRETFLPRRTELEVEESRFTVALKDVAKNPEFAEKDFSFDAPPGARVIDFPGLGGR